MTSWWQSGYGSLGTIAGSGPFVGQHFEYFSENSTHIFFEKVAVDGTHEGSSSTIKFSKVDGSWSDEGSGWPSDCTVSADGNNVELAVPGSWGGYFTNPNAANPYSSGGSTGTTSSTSKKVFCNFW